MITTKTNNATIIMVVVVVLLSGCPSRGALGVKPEKVTNKMKQNQISKGSQRIKFKQK